MDKSYSSTINGPSSPIAAKFPTKDSSAVIGESSEGTIDIDETLIEGWTETILDRAVAKSWPSFTLYQLRTPISVPSSAEAATPNTVHWLAIETYIFIAPPEPEVPSSPGGKGAKVKRSSSVKSDIKRPRFGLFSSTSSLVKDKDVKEEKKERKKDHSRRASEISTETKGMKRIQGRGRSKSMGVWII
jgi:hypothetical protein